MARPAPVLPRAVAWRDGVHLGGTPIWCDAGASREVLFVSHAGVRLARQHKQLLATADTVALLPDPARRRSPRQGPPLTPRYGRPFSLGELRVELYPSGFVRGAASLVVDVKGTRVAYAGAIAPGVRAADWAGEVRAADVLVVDASFAHARWSFPPRAEALARVKAFVTQALADGVTPVLLAPPLPTGLTLVAALADALGEGQRLVAPRGLHDAARRLRALEPALPAVRRAGAELAPGDVLLWPLDGREPAVPPIPRARVALCDGRALDAAYVARLGVDAAIPLADRAGHDDLVAYVAACGASQVFAVNGDDEGLAALRAAGIDAALLGPPSQLALFR